MSSTADDLLRCVLSGAPDELRDELAPLDEERRRELFLELGGIFDKLREAGRQGVPGRTVDVETVAAEVDSAEGFVRAWGRLGEKLALRDGRLFTNVQCAWVGLARTSEDAALGLRRLDDDPRFIGSGRENLLFLLRVGRVLVDRPEPWRRELVVELLARHDEWVTGRCEALPLLVEVLERVPEWRDDVLIHAGRIVSDEYLGRSRVSWAGKGPAVASELVLIGLAHEPPRSSRSTILSTNAVEDVLRLSRSGGVERSALIDLTLRRLLDRHSPRLAQGWGELFDRLALTEDELAERRARVVDLLSVNHGSGVRVGLAMLKRLCRHDAFAPAELLSSILPALTNPRESAAQAAGDLLAQLVARGGEWADAGAWIYLESLTSRHAFVREVALRWLEERGGEPLSPAHRSRASELRPCLHPHDRERLDACFPGLGDEVASVEPMREAVPETGVEGVLQGAPFPVPSTAIELSRLLTSLRSPELSERELEGVLAGLLRVRKGQWEVSSGTVESRLNSRTKSMRSPPDESPDVFRTDRLLLREVLATWRGNSPGRPCRPSTPRQARLVHVIERLRDGGSDQLLATPTQCFGWLQPAVFAERYDALPIDQVGSEDLHAALLRLPVGDEPREAVWSVLGERCASATEGPDRAIAIAFGPVEKAEPLVRSWLEELRLSKRQDGSRPALAKERTADGHERRACFRLLFAALHARIGWSDLRAVFPVLGHESSREVIDDHLDVSCSAPKLRRVLVDTFLSGRPVDRRWLATATNPQADGRPGPDQFAFHGDRTEHPRLAPWVAVKGTPGSLGETMAEERFLEPFVFPQPGAAQRFFEVGAARRLDRQHDAKPVFLSLGKLPWVEPSDGVAGTLELWLSRQARHRERGRELIRAWLIEGRVPPSRLATEIAKLVIGCSKKKLGLVLGSLRALAEHDLAGRVVVAWALEQPGVLPRGIEELATSIRQLKSGTTPEVLALASELMKDESVPAVAKAATRIVHAVRQWPVPDREAECAAALSAVGT
ncbi:MAG: DUF6493 family protein [Acidobacteriota bacterium]